MKYYFLDKVKLLTVLIIAGIAYSITVPLAAATLRQDDEGRYFNPGGLGQQNQKQDENGQSIAGANGNQNAIDDQDEELDKVPQVTKEQIENAQAQLQARDGMDPELRDQIQQLLQSAKQQIDARDGFQTQREEFERQIARIPDNLKRIQERQQETRETPEEWVRQRQVESMDRETIAELIRTTEAELERINRNLTNRRAEMERRPARSSEIPARISELEGAIAQINQRLKTAPPAGEAQELTAARGLLRQAELMAFSQEIQTLRREQERNRANRDLLPQQIEFGQRDIQFYSAVLKSLREIADRKQAQQLLEIREQAKQRLLETVPLLRAYAQHDLLDMTQIEESTERIREATTQFQSTTSQREQDQIQFAALQESYEAVGRLSALGTKFRQMLKRIDQASTEVQSQRKLTEQLRKAAEEKRVLLNNELGQDLTAAADSLVKGARDAAGFSRLQDFELIKQQLGQNNFELVRQLAGLPPDGVPHEDDLEDLSDTLAADVIEMLPALHRQIASLRPTANFAVFLNRDDPAVKEFSIYLFLLQEVKDLIHPEDFAWLQDSGWKMWVDRGEELFSAEAVKSAQSRMNMIQKQLRTVNEEIDQLASLDVEQHRHKNSLQDHAKWINERVIWIRSASLPGMGDLYNLKRATFWLVDPGNWFSMFDDLKQASSKGWFIYFPIGLVAIIIFGFQRIRLSRVLRANGELAAKKYCLRLSPTTKSLIATLLLSIIYPLATFLTGHMLVASSAIGGFTAAVGQALIDVSYFLAAIELLRWLVTDHGLAISHFGWPEKTVQVIRGKIRSLYVIAIPMLFVQGIMLAQSNDDFAESLGRLASASLFIVIAWIMHRLFRPNGVIFQQLASNNQLPGIYALRGVIHLTAVAIPVALFLLTVFGYYYAAYRLGASLEKSLLLTTVILYIGGFAFRWLLITRRSQAMEEARRIREEMERSPEQAETTEEGGMTPIEQLMEELLTVNRQSREAVVSMLWLLAFGMLYFIWQDLIPAIGFLDEKKLWSVSVGSDVKDVTYLSLLYAAAAAVITWMLVKNMPGLLNMVVQTYSSLDSGARYAATTLFRYVITIVGTVTALNFLHIQWAQYGWLVAAVSVGLGFGLQEIVANFVSGLILLFERPLRIGDVITIDNQTGIVTRIQMRATTIRNWDHQELIIPNKDLMTGKLLNWTLSNPTNRLVIQIGVAYGSDPDRVRQILIDVLNQHPDVLKDPAPVVAMEEFGDSALEFHVRCLLSAMDGRARVRHEINSAIVRAFAKEGISIPFPQRDLHIVSDMTKNKKG